MMGWEIKKGPLDSIWERGGQLLQGFTSKYAQPALDLLSRTGVSDTSLGLAIAQGVVDQARNAGDAMVDQANGLPAAHAYNGLMSLKVDPRVVDEFFTLMPFAGMAARTPRAVVSSIKDAGRAFMEAQVAGMPHVLPPGSPKIRGLPDTVDVPGRGPVKVQPHEGIRQALHDYKAAAGIDAPEPPTSLLPVDPKKAKAVADAFDAMPHAPNDPKVRSAYDALARETVAQWDALKKTGIKVEFIKPGMDDPYKASPRLAHQDVIENNHLWVYPTDSGFGSGEAAQAAMKDNPMLAMTDEVVDGHKLRVNDVFRIVHDLAGHVAEGNGFRANGEELAAQLHASLYSPEARKALMTETRGQNSWVNFGPNGAANRAASSEGTVYAPQKVGLLPDWATEQHYTPPDARALKTAEVSRAKRRAGTTGQYVGAPKGIDSPQKYSALVDSYARRVERAIDAGLEPGWFYGKGRQAIADVATTPRAADAFAKTNAVTSSEAPVASNVGWAIKAHEQAAAGVPINSGKYPNTMRDLLTRVVKGTDEHLGHKRDRYGNGLNPNGDPNGLAPNDRWEIRSFGYDKDTAGPAQHDFMDEVRQKALERVNKRRGLNLTPLEAQELNWAVQRADDMGISVQDSARDVVHGAMDKFAFQHSWESTPGESSAHLPQLRAGNQADWRAHHANVKSLLVDENGKDRLLSAFGGELQPRAFDGPGVFKGQVAPGTQSRSLVYQTVDKGMDPSSRARVQATEATRSLLLGQDAYGGHSLLPAKSLKQVDTLSVDLGHTLRDDQALPLLDRLRELYGDTTVVVPTENGFNLLNLSGENFGKRTKNLVQDLLGVADVKGVVGGRRAESSIYNELPWDSGQATQHVLEQIDNPAAPALAQHADSPAMRELAGKMADLYEGMPGKNERLQQTLRAWQSGGLEAVRELVKKGLAPAAVLSLLAARNARRPTPEG